MADILDSLKMFHDGLVQLNTQSAVNDATKQLQDANASASNEKERLVQNQQVGQQLAMRLTAGGASPDKIAAATSGLMSSANNAYSMQAEKDMQQQGFTHAEAIQKTLFQQQKEIEQMKLDAMTGKGAQKAYDAQATSFEKRPDVSAIIKNLPDLKGTLEELKQGANKPESVMFSTLAKIGMLKKANGGRPSQQEFAAMGDSPAWYDQVRKQMGIQTTNALPADKQAFWVGILSRAEGRMQQDMSKLIDSHANAAAELNDNVDADKLKNALHTKYSSYLGTGEAETTPSAGKTVAKKMYSASRNQTKIIYADGTEQILDGRK